MTPIFNTANPADPRSPICTVTTLSAGHEVMIEGAIGARSSESVRRGLWDAMLAGNGDLVIHLGDAFVTDSTGLGVLVGVHHGAAMRGRRLVIADASPRLQRLLRATKLHRVLMSEEPMTFVQLEDVALQEAV